MSSNAQETTAGPARWPALLNEEEAGKYLGVTRVTLFRLRRARVLPYLRVGRCVRYRKASLDAWIAREERGGEWPDGKPSAARRRSITRTEGRS